jgi:hypothetical protein
LVASLERLSERSLIVVVIGRPIGTKNAFGVVLEGQPFLGTLMTARIGSLTMLEGADGWGLKYRKIGRGFS